MRPQRFELPNNLYYDEYSKLIDIYTETAAELDDDGNEIPEGRQYILQDYPADIQPKAGGRIQAESGTVYESSHALFLPGSDRPIPRGAKIEARTDYNTEHYIVVFVADLGSHLELSINEAQP